MKAIEICSNKGFHSLPRKITAASCIVKKNDEFKKFISFKSMKHKTSMVKKILMLLQIKGYSNVKNPNMTTIHGVIFFVR